MKEIVQTYAIVQEKGGGGKSPVAVHLGYGASYRNMDTLVIDLDPQGSVSQHWLGAAYDEQEPTVYDPLVTLTRIEPLQIQEHLFLLPAHSGLEKAEIELPRPGAFYQVQLQKMLKLYPEFPCRIIDTPGSRISIFATLALTAADYAVIPCKCELAHYYGTIDTLGLVHDIQAGLNPYLAVWGIVPTQFETSKHHGEILDLLRELRDPIGTPYQVYGTPSRKTTKYNDAMSMRVDVRRLDNTGLLAQYWDRLAADLLNGKKEEA